MFRRLSCLCIHKDVVGPSCCFVYQIITIHTHYAATQHLGQIQLHVRRHQRGPAPLCVWDHRLRDAHVPGGVLPLLPGALNQKMWIEQIENCNRPSRDRPQPTYQHHQHLPQNLSAVHKYEPPARHYQLASVALVHAAIAARDQHGLPIVGIDIAGQEAGYPAAEHTSTVRGSASVHSRQSVRVVHANRTPPTV